MNKSILRASAALQAVAFLGAGIATSAIFATPAAAQDYTSVSAAGRVVNATGAPVPGATVVIKSNAQGFTRTVTTDSAGAYRVSDLPEGSYTYTITAPGLTTFTDPNVQLSLSNASNEFQLVSATAAPAGAAAAGGGEAIVVTGRRVRTSDFAATTVGSVINVGELATRVPVARDVTSVVLLSPGTTLGDNAFGNLPSIAGSSVSENTYYVNGLNITNIRNGLGAVTVPFDFYQTLDVKNGGYGAEFGRATGGFINAVTKSGGNKFHGGITVNYEPDKLSSNSPRTYLSDNDSAYFERKDVIAQLSGPIIKDRLFFYGLYQFRDVVSKGGTTSAVSAIDPRISSSTGLPLRTPPSQSVLDYSCFINPQYCASGSFLPSNLPAVPSSTDRLQQFALAGTGYSVTRSSSPFMGGKIDAIPFDGHRFEFTIFDTSSTTRTTYFGTNFFSLASGNRYNPNTNAPGAALPLDRGGELTQTSGGLNYVGRYTGQFTDWLTLSAGYGRNYNKTTTVSSGPNTPAITDTRAGVNIPLGNPNTIKGFTNDRRDFYRADADVRFSLLGTHHVRAGYDRENLTASSSSSYNGDYAFTYYPAATFGTAGPVVSRRYFKNGGSFKTIGEAFYIEDSWKLFNDRLNLNLGIRDDRFTNKNNLGDAFFKSGDNYAPRVGFSFDPTGGRRTKIYGSFSRYFLGIPLNTNTRLAGQELDYTQYYALTGTNPDNSPIYGAAINNDSDATGTGPCPRLAIDTVTGGGTANCTINQNGEQPPYKTLVAQNLKAQSVDEILLGAEQRLGGRWKVGAYVTKRTLKKSLEDAYIDKGVTSYCSRTFTAAADAGTLADCLSVFSGAHQYSLINPGSDVIVALNAPGTALDGKTVTLTAADLGLPKANRVYKSVTFTFDREFDGKWSLSGSYTLSSLKGNIEGGVRSDNGQADSGLTTAFDFPSLMNGAYGFLPGHRKHNFKLYGSYAPTDWLTVGANLQVTSPRKFGCIGRVPNTVDPVAGAGYGASGFYCNVVNGKVVLLNNANGFVFSNSYNPAVNTLSLTPRASQLKSDWLYNLNLDASIKVPTKAFDAYVRVSVFNVLNRKAVLDLQEVGTSGGGAPSATYGQPLSYQPPRSARIQFGVSF